MNVTMLTLNPERIADVALIDLSTHRQSHRLTALAGVLFLDAQCLVIVAKALRGHPAGTVDGITFTNQITNIAKE